MTTETAVVMSGTANLAFAMANVMSSITRNSPNVVSEFIIYHDDMDNHDKDCLAAFGPCRFIQYDPHPSLFSLRATPKIKQFSVMSFGLFEMFNHLDEFETVIYLDCDLLVQRDISEIVQYGPVAMVPGRLTISEACGLPDLGGKFDDRTARNTGVVVITRDLPDYSDYRDLAYEHTARFWNTLVLPDQGILNYLFALKDVEVVDLPVTFNMSKGNRGVQDAAVIRAQGSLSKFWNNGVSNLMFPEWNLHYSLWLAAGGKPFEGKRYYWDYAGLSQTELYRILKEARAAGIAPAK